MAVQITGSQIKNGAVSTSQLSDDSVTSAKIQDSQITSAKLAASSVVSSKIGTGALDTTSFFANSVISAAKANLTETWDFSSGTLRAGTPSGSNQHV